MKGAQAQLFSRGTRQSSCGRIRVGKLISRAENERHESIPASSEGLEIGLNEWWSHESSLELGSPVTEVLLLAKSFERQLQGLFYDNTRVVRDVALRKIRSFRSFVLFAAARRGTSTSISKSSMKLEVRREIDCAGGDYA